MLLLLGSLPASAFAQAAPPTGSSDDSGYDIRDDVLIKTHDGATLSATVVRKKGVTQPLPTLLTFDIYTDPAAFRSRGKDAADHGYVGVTADTRGKRLSPEREGLINLVGMGLLLLLMLVVTLNDVGNLFPR